MTEPANGDRKPPERNGNGDWNAACGRQLALVRGACGLSQREFADKVREVLRRSDPDVRLGVRTVFNWEKGAVNPRAENKAAIVAVLGGRDHPRWDLQENLDLACCLGIRVSTEDPPPPPPPPEPSTRHRAWRTVAIVSTAVLLVYGLSRVFQPPPVPFEPNIVCGLPWTVSYDDGSTRILPAESRNGEFVVRYNSVRDLDGDGRPEILIVGIDTDRCTETSGQIRIECYSDEAGFLWRYFLDVAPPYRDGSRYSAHEWSLENVDVFDWTGDGRLEVAIVATHKMYPSLLDVVDADGNRVCRYANAGHMKDFAILPASFYTAITQQAQFDVPPARGPGTALAISAQTNESPPGCHLIVLPPGFREGAYPARTPHYQHAELTPAEDAIFIRLRPSLVARSYPAGHNWPDEISFDPTSQRIQVGTIEEPGGEAILRFFDATLQQVSVIPTDRFRHKYSEMQQELRLDPIDSEEMTVSVEMIDHREGKEWVPSRSRGSWRP